MNFPQLTNRTYASLTTCSHCHGRFPASRLYRLAGVGLRPLCFPCYKKLDDMGMRIWPAS